jgi:hypothetical protein
MNPSSNVFLSFLVTLSARLQHRSLYSSSLKRHFETFAFNTLLRLWRVYKLACRIVTGKCAIERLCQRIAEEPTLSITEKSIEFDNRKTKSVIWRIGKSSQGYLFDF